LKTSIIIPSRNEPYLVKTVNNILITATGDIEIIIMLDGKPWETELSYDRRITILRSEKPMGRRKATNSAVGVARGEYLMKCDAHCAFAEGFDEVLKADCADNWIVIPRRYELDAPSWTILDQEPEEAMFYIYPWGDPDRIRFACRPWRKRALERKEILLDEDMGFQGSMWFMAREHWDRLGKMNENGYGSFVSEPEEIGLKTWLGPWDGAVMRNKRTWYAHWSKPSTHWHAARGMLGWIPEKEWWDGWAYCADYWMRNRWPERAHDIEWLIEKFWPLPNWPEDWIESKAVFADMLQKET